MEARILRIFRFHINPLELPREILHLIIPTDKPNVFVSLSVNPPQISHSAHDSAPLLVVRSISMICYDDFKISKVCTFFKRIINHNSLARQTTFCQNGVGNGRWWLTECSDLLLLEERRRSGELSLFHLRSEEKATAPGVRAGRLVGYGRVLFPLVKIHISIHFTLVQTERTQSHSHSELHPTSENILGQSRSNNTSQTQEPHCNPSNLLRHAFTTTFDDSIRVEYSNKEKL